MRHWRALIVLSMAQFLMVLDQAVMNVSISQLVEDFDTSVTVIQGVITAYALVMAMFMVTGGKLGDRFGRRRIFTVGHIIYGVGSALTAIAWDVPVLLLGWSILEGVGAALVLPALVGLIAANYEGKDRVAAFGVIGGVSGVGIAAGPIIGGYFTANLSWRWVFVGEVALVLIIVATVRLIRDAPLEGRRPTIDVVGATLSALGLGTVVFSVLQASSWGWVNPKNSPVAPFGFSPTPFLFAAGLLLLALFVSWQRHRERVGADPLVRLSLFSIPPLRSGVESFLLQNTVLLGVFFTLPLYLQIVLGFDALETGIRMLPISIAMFITSSCGPALTMRFSIRTVVRAGFVLLAVASFLMLETIRPQLDGPAFVVALTILGVGMGLIASQLGNAIQSAVGTADRGEAGGLQYTAQQLGSALGTALIGAIVISSLVGVFVDRLEDDERLDPDLVEALGVEIDSGLSFVASDDLAAALATGGLEADETAVVVDNYEDAQIGSLKAGLLLTALISLLAIVFTGGLPSRPPDSQLNAKS